MRVETYSSTTKEIPAEVIADRDRRAKLAHASAIAKFCGDPLPGYSAADAPPSSSKQPDPLASLMYTPRLKVAARYG